MSGQNELPELYMELRFGVCVCAKEKLSQKRTHNLSSAQEIIKH